jgi:hypothetical protein
VLVAARWQSDATLGALLTEVANGDQLAGRVVLQAMVGRIVRMAARDPYAGIDEYLGALWCEILTYPLVRRPQKIAANLSMDALKSVCRERRGMTQAEVTPWPPEVFVDELFEQRDSVLRRTRHQDSRVIDARQVLVTGRELCVIDESSRALLHSVFVDGLSGREAALRHRTSAGSVRVRCSKAVRRLAARASDLVDAA